MKKIPPLGPKEKCLTAQSMIQAGPIKQLNVELLAVMLKLYTGCTEK